jgi:hypothetical protein
MRLPPESPPNSDAPSPVPETPSDSDNDSIPALEPSDPADIPLPIQPSPAAIAAASAITIPPLRESRVIDSAISLLSFLIRQEPLSRRYLILNRVLRVIADQVYGERNSSH